MNFSRLKLCILFFYKTGKRTQIGGKTTYIGSETVSWQFYTYCDFAVELKNGGMAQIPTQMRQKGLDNNLRTIGTFPFQNMAGRSLQNVRITSQAQFLFKKKQQQPQFRSVFAGIFNL